MVFWASDGDLGGFDRALASDPTVEPVRSIDADGRRLYEVDIVGEGAETDLFPLLVETTSIVDRATVTEDGWHCRFLFTDHAVLLDLFETCRDREVQYEVDRLDRSDGFASAPERLSGPQREALRVAREVGYFEVPRTGTLQDVADRLDVSSTVASNRIRRGVKVLVEERLRSEFDDPLRP